VHRFGPEYGLPPVYSGQNELHRLGPPPESADVAILALQGRVDRFRNWFASCETVGPLDNGVGVANEENEEAVVYICRGRLRAWRDIWPDLQHYD
jgi:hypothetical protein